MINSTSIKRIISRILIATLSLSLYVAPITSIAASKNNHAVSTETIGIRKQFDSDSSYEAFTVYDLGKERTYGMSPNSNIDFEAFYGVRLKVNGDSISITTYDHTGNYPESAVMISKMITMKQDSIVKSFGYIDVGETITYTPSESGAYAVINMIDKDNKNNARGYFYFDGSNISTCRVVDTSTERFASQIDYWNNLMDDADPKNYLSNKDTTYPTSGTEDRCVHVDEYEAIAEELLSKYNRTFTTDDAKVFLFVYYIVNHYAYDNYRCNDLNMVSRANIAGIYNDDNYYLYGNHVGLCWDFANVLCIMCRYAGIPCTSVENDTHTANAVYLYDEWVMIDVTQLLNYCCNTQDTSKEKWKTSTADLYQNYYGTYDYDNIFNTHDYEIWNIKNINRYKNMAG